MIRPLGFATLISAALALPAGPAHGAEKMESDDTTKARARVIIDNDFGGDPDGLFQLAHQLLSPSVEVRGIIGSHHYPKGFYGNPGGPESACAAAHELLAVMNLEGKVPVHQGAGPAIGEDGAPVSSAAAASSCRRR